MKNKNQGFTLVELIVSFVILMMLASISLVGILAYQDFADFKRQNSYASTLFSAAQSELTSMSVRGSLKELLEVSDSELLLDTVVTDSGKKASDSQNGLETKSGTIYYLTGTKETYQKYLAGEYAGKSDIESKKYQMLYRIFDSYIMDKSVLNAAISIEYEPERGLVYSVLYSDKVASFTYTAKNKEGRVNILNRQESYRSEYMIGFYGVDR